MPDEGKKTDVVHSFVPTPHPTPNLRLYREIARGYGRRSRRFAPWEGRRVQREALNQLTANARSSHGKKVARSDCHELEDAG